MEFKVAKVLNKYLNILTATIKKLSVDFNLIIKIRQIDDYDFIRGKFNIIYEIYTQINRNEALEKIGITDEYFEELSNLNETLDNLKREKEIEGSELKVRFNFHYKRFNNFYDIGNKLSPILVEDFYNKKFKILDFKNNHHNSYWDVNTWETDISEINLNQQRQFIFLYFSDPIRKSYDIKYLETFKQIINENEFNDNIWSLVKIIFLYTSNKNDSIDFYSGINFKDKSFNLYKEKQKRFCRDTYHDIIDNLSYDYNYEKAKREENSAREFNFQLSHHNSYLNDCPQNIEYYFFDRRHYANLNSDNFQEGFCYLVSPDGILINKFISNRSNLKEKITKALASLIPAAKNNNNDNNKSFNSRTDDLNFIFNDFLNFNKIILNYSNKDVVKTKNHQNIFFTIKNNIYLSLSKDNTVILKNKLYKPLTISFILSEKYKKMLKTISRKIKKYEIHMVRNGIICSNNKEEAEKCINYIIEKARKEYSTELDYTNFELESLHSDELSMKYKFSFKGDAQEEDMLVTLKSISQEETAKEKLDSIFVNWSLFPQIEERDSFCNICDVYKIEKAKLIPNQKISCFKNSITIIIFWNASTYKSDEIIEQSLKMIFQQIHVETATKIFVSVVSVNSNSHFIQEYVRHNIDLFSKHNTSYYHIDTNNVYGQLYNLDNVIFPRIMVIRDEFILIKSKKINELSKILKELF